MSVPVECNIHIRNSNSEHRFFSVVGFLYSPVRFWIIMGPLPWLKMSALVEYVYSCIVNFFVWKEPNGTCVLWLVFFLYVAIWFGCLSHINVWMVYHCICKHHNLGYPNYLDCENCSGCSLKIWPISITQPQPNELDSPIDQSHLCLVSTQVILIRQV